jgi:hypothetical protein
MLWLDSTASDQITIYIEGSVKNTQDVDRPRVLQKIGNSVMQAPRHELYRLSDEVVPAREWPLPCQIHRNLSTSFPSPNDLHRRRTRRAAVWASG